MVSSDWGEWLPAAVERSAPDGVAIWYLGCNGFILKGEGGTTLFIDPYLGTGDPPRTVRMIPVPFDPRDVVSADAVLTTHEHVDHVHGPSQAPILAETGADFYAPDASLAVTDDGDWTDQWAVTDDQLSAVDVGDSIDVGEFSIHVEDANELRLDTLLPSHWDMWKGVTADPTALYHHVRSFPYPKRLDVVEIGDRIDL